MNPQTASRTALATSLMRAIHTRADPHPILDDPWGDRLVPAATWAAIYQLARTRNPSLPETDDESIIRSTVDTALRDSAAYPNVIVRSRYAEDALHRAVARGVRQYVLIGAGFDSYALRAPPDATEVVVIEIDHPATQSLKRQCITRSGAASPGRVHFVPSDLSTEDLSSVLRNSPLRASEPAFFSWLGVTMYLDREANFKTLRALASTAAPGSELVFTYLDHAFFDEQDRGASSRAHALRKAVAALGEPFVCGFDPAALRDDLAQLGYLLLEDHADTALVRQYDPLDLNKLSPTGVSRSALVRVASGRAA